MLDLIIIFLFIMGLIVGIRRGFIMQIVHLSGFIAAFVVAYMFYADLAPKLKLWVPMPSFGNAEFSMFFETISLDTAYYRAVAFAILFFGTRIAAQIIGSMLDFLSHLPILKQVNSWAGAVLGFVEVYLIVFIFLYIGALVPLEMVQTSISDSSMAKGIVENTPIFSEKLQELWSGYLASKQ
ncbi:CvpA family protein [Sutcliffiella horikoshii]|uniref:CvpA family protein n=1 Tax=Sutcliffiella horikoshii TaxID=79883 RepID=A0A5D4T268_9BACI|nr:CvpA family protein [Sutcliffiella horikoshii]TYS69001.1 CvpA family protein [Sutcliffiella horikoshii]